jgi:hypothetical protein
VSERDPHFDRDEVIVCMTISFCLAGAIVQMIYRVMT